MLLSLYFLKPTNQYSMACKLIFWSLLLRNVTCFWNGLLRCNFDRHYALPRNEWKQLIFLQGFQNYFSKGITELAIWHAKDAFLWQIISPITSKDLFIVMVNVRFFSNALKIGTKIHFKIRPSFFEKPITLWIIFCKVPQYFFHTICDSHDTCILSTKVLMISCEEYYNSCPLQFTPPFWLFCCCCCC